MCRVRDICAYIHVEMRSHMLHSCVSFHCTSKRMRMYCIARHMRLLLLRSIYRLSCLFLSGHITCLYLSAWCDNSNNTIDITCWWRTKTTVCVRRGTRCNTSRARGSGGRRYARVGGKRRRDDDWTILNIMTWHEWNEMKVATLLTDVRDRPQLQQDMTCHGTTRCYRQ